MKAAAIAAIIATASAGVEPVFATRATAGAASDGRHATSHNRAVSSGPDAPSWVLQFVGRDGAISLDRANVKRPSGPGGALTVTPAKLEEARRAIHALRLDPDPKIAAAAEAIENLTEIAMVADATKRHAKIRRLPVSILDTPATDGRDGTIRTFMAGGKPRVRLFVPARESDAVVAEAPAQYGPSITDSETGRWKSDGSGGCYWDANDDGPDQCSADIGRWKSDGDGGCYYDGGDSGPDQCLPPDGGGAGGYTCYFEGNPDPCLTQEAYEDFLIVIAQGEADYDSYVSEAESVDADYADWCNNNPYECGLEVMPGPSVSLDADFDCGSQKGGAWLSIGGLGYTLWSATSLAAGPAAAITVGATALAIGGVALAIGAVAVAVYAYKECRDLLPQLNVPAFRAQPLLASSTFVEGWREGARSISMSRSGRPAQETWVRRHWSD